MSYFHLIIINFTHLLLCLTNLQYLFGLEGMTCAHVSTGHLIAI